MEKKNKKELLSYIDEQNKSLQKYKSRLHDVVESYKNLVKEKEALESSVKFLTDGNSPEKNSGLQSNIQSDEVSEKNKSNVDEEDGSDNFDSLRRSLRTLTIEKSRIENELKTDRKRLLKEKEELQNQLKELQDVLQDERSTFETSIREHRKQIRDQQKEREKEQQDHAVMLKELQSLVADERCSKEKNEQQLENLKLALEKLPDKRFEYEKRIIELQNELLMVKESLRAAEGEKKDLPSLLRQLQQEMSEMKVQHQEAVEREMLRSNDAEEKLKALVSLSEDRAASLEERLSELSQIVGNYDKLRQQDQIAIQKLKERVAQLDQENSALASTVAGAGKNYSFEDDIDLDVQTIMDRITRLKGYLRLANQNSKRSVSFSEGLLSEIQKDEEINPHAACQKESKQLREELQQCKQKLQSLKDSHAMDQASHSTINCLKRQVRVLEEEVETCRMQMESMEERHQKTECNLQRCISESKANHDQEMIIQRAKYHSRVLELEQQLQKQRERSLMLLEDKEKEIMSLRSMFKLQGKQLQEDERDIPEQNLCTSQESVEENQLTDLLSTSVMYPKKGKLLLHYTQEMAHKDVEISNLRRCRIAAETALRELQQNTLLKEENYQDEIDILKSKIARLQIIQKGVNMEYLKNVILRFIKCGDANDQSHMINAIAAILHFTPAELQEIKAHRQSWLWSMQRTA